MQKENKQIRSGVYKSGIAINTEQKAKEMVRKLKERAQNKETKKSTEKDIVCKYYPHFCKVVGHTSAACKKCEMYGTSKDEKKKALREIANMEIAAQVAILKSEGKSYFGRFLAIYFLCIFKLIYFYILSIRISILIFLVKLHLIIVRRIWIGCT